MSIIKVDTIQNRTGGSAISVPGAAKAWVNFDGTGVVNIRASMNVSSITDNGVGDYSANFTTAFPDANYALTAFGGVPSGSNCRAVAADVGFSQTTTAARFQCIQGTGSRLDFDWVHVAFFR